MRWIAVLSAALLTVAVLAGCGTSNGSTQQQGTTAKTVAVTITKGTISPAPGRVPVAAGTTVTIEVSSDSTDEVHVHGYNIEKPVSQGHPVRITFVANQTGLFEVETHVLDKTLFQLQVQ